MPILSTENGSALLRDGTFSDFVITCQEFEFHVHRVIIATTSDFFKVVCLRDFKEKQESCVDFPDEHPHTIAQVLSFMYTRDYAEEPEKNLLTYGRARTSSTKCKAANRNAPTANIVPQPEGHFGIEIAVFRFSSKIGLADGERIAEERIKFKACFSAARKTLAKDIRSFYEMTHDNETKLRMTLLRACAFLHQTQSDNMTREEWLTVLRELEPWWGLLEDVSNWELVKCSESQIACNLLNGIATQNKECSCGAAFSPILRFHEVDVSKFRVYCSHCGREEIVVE